MRGEKGIRILAPSPYKIRQEVEKKDPQMGKTVIGKDGKPVTETKGIQIPAYKVVAVFEVSQTEGRKLAELKSSLETIRVTAAEIINSIDGHFAELQKERESAKQQEAEMETPPDLTAEPTVTILWSESSQLRYGESVPIMYWH